MFTRTQSRCIASRGAMIYNGVMNNSQAHNAQKAKEALENLAVAVDAIDPEIAIGIMQQADRIESAWPTVKCPVWPPEELKEVEIATQNVKGSFAQWEDGAITLIEFLCYAWSQVTPRMVTEYNEQHPNFKLIRD